MQASNKALIALTISPLMLFINTNNQNLGISLPLFHWAC